MYPENASLTRCVRHPSQFFTGFCSSCLVERLSNVNSVRRSPEPSRGQRDVVDLSLSNSDFEAKPPQVRVRRTLSSLFHLDDNDAYDAEKEENAMKADGFRFSDNRYEAKAKGIPRGNGSENFESGVNFDPEARVLESRVGPETSASSSYGAIEESSFDAHVVKKLCPGKEDNLKHKGVSFWLGSVFSKRALNWRMRSTSKKHSLHHRSRSGGLVEEFPEAKYNFRHSCDWNMSRDSSKASWEDPRHSWDGSMMSRAFTCSFSCVEEAEDEKLDNLWEFDGPSSSVSQRRKGSLPDLTEEDTPAYTEPSTTTTDTSKNYNTRSSIQESSSSLMSRGKPLRDRFHEESHQDIAVPGISRRKSHRWSKVWNWSITSPFRDAVQIQQPALERSLSESWRESHKVKNMEMINTNIGVHFYGNGISSSRVAHSLNRSKNTGNVDLHNLRPDWQMKKRDYKFGRSRSVHYSSPGNLDNGLLRFYLTPLRSSRRNTNRGRMKTSRSFGRSIFGLY